MIGGNTIMFCKCRTFTLSHLVIILVALADTKPDVELAQAELSFTRMIPFTLWLDRNRLTARLG
jgi:hypothetical protein